MDLGVAYKWTLARGMDLGVNNKINQGWHGWLKLNANLTWRGYDHKFRNPSRPWHDFKSGHF